MSRPCQECSILVEDDFFSISSLKTTEEEEEIIRWRRGAVLIVGGEVQGWRGWYFSVVVHNQKDESVESQSIDCATERSYTSPQVAEGRGGLGGAISSS